MKSCRSVSFPLALRPCCASSSLPCTESQGELSLIICVLSVTLPFLLSNNYISPFHFLYFFLYHFESLSDSIFIHSGKCPPNMPLCFSSPYLSRSEWLFPISLHQMDGAFQGPWRWCCSLGDIRLAHMFEGCLCTIQWSGSWKTNVNTATLHFY